MTRLRIIADHRPKLQAAWAFGGKLKIADFRTPGLLAAAFGVGELRVVEMQGRMPLKDSRPSAGCTASGGGRKKHEPRISGRLKLHFEDN